MPEQIPAVFDRYLCVWNESDDSLLDGHVRASCADDIVFADPNEYTVGHVSLLAMARTVRSELPGASYRRTSGVDVQNRRYRYLWEIEFRGDIVVRGMDVATLNELGMIERIDGFFTHLPPAAQQTD